MKKLLFFVYGIILLTSCSQDEGFTNTEDVLSKKMFPVTFNIESDAFSVETEPINDTKSSPNNQYYGQQFLQYIIYSESGEVYSNKITGAESWNKIVSEGKALIKDTLPEGNYHVAIVTGKCGNYQIPHYYYINPINYFTDYYTPNTSPSSALNSNNSETYYNTFDLVVGKENNTVAIKLEPTWSYITLNMHNLDKMEIPEYADGIIIYANPNLKGFSIKDIKAKGYTIGANEFPAAGKFAEMPLESFFANNHFSTRTCTAASDSSVSIEIKFLRLQQIIKTIKLGSFNVLENNKNYKVTIDHKLMNEQKVGFDVTINPFTGEDVDVELQ